MEQRINIKYWHTTQNFSSLDCAHPTDWQHRVTVRALVSFILPILLQAALSFCLAHFPAVATCNPRLSFQTWLRLSSVGRIPGHLPIHQVLILIAPGRPVYHNTSSVLRLFGKAFCPYWIIQSIEGRLSMFCHVLTWHLEHGS